jgi:spermidine/putrescine transport system permease protein
MMESATPAVLAPSSAPSIGARGWRWLREHTLHIYAGFAVAYMLVPIVVVAVFSFADAPPRDRLLFAINDGFTLEYWESAFSVPELNDAMLTSLELATLATLASTAIGTLMAMALVRYRFFGRRTSNLLIILPMATPEIVIGAALLSMFLIYSVPLGFTSLLIAHIMFSISFVVVVVRSRLIGFDRSIEDAAADLGATPVETFRYVTLPLLAPGILAAGLLAFALSVDDFIISDFNKGTTETFPLYVFGAHLRGVPVQVNVLATILFAVTLAAIALVIWQQRRAERLATIRPEPERVEPYRPPAFPPAPGAAGG